MPVPVSHIRLSEGKKPCKEQMGLAIGSIIVTIACAVMAWVDAIPRLRRASYVVVWLTLLSLFLLFEGLPSEGVLPCATLFLNIFGFLSLQEAWGGFSNDVVLSVAGLGVVASILSRTGVIDKVFSKKLS